MKIRYFIAAYALLLLMGIFAPKIQAHLTKASFDRNKQVVTVTKVVSPNHLLAMISQQTKLDERFRASKKNILIAKEETTGLDKANDIYVYLTQHPKYKKVEMKLQETKSQSNGKAIHFISACRIIKVYSNGKWKIYK